MDEKSKVSGGAFVYVIVSYQPQCGANPFLAMSIFFILPQTACQAQLGSGKTSIETL
jgi:hypothetical protein